MTKWCKAWPDSCLTNSDQNQLEENKLTDPTLTEKSLPQLLNDAFPEPNESDQLDDLDQERKQFKHTNEEIEELKKEILKKDHQKELVINQTVAKFDIKNYIILGLIISIGCMVFAMIFSRLASIEKDIKYLTKRLLKKK